MRNHARFWLRPEVARGAVAVFRRAQAILALMVCVLVAGCGGERQASNGADATLEDLPRLQLDLEWRIGSLDDPEVGFTNLGDAVYVDPGDTVFVVEASVPEIRAYSPEGGLVRRIGSRGQGPGEFLGMGRWGGLGDTLWVIDHGQRRITLLHREGTVLATLPYRSVEIREAAPYSATVAPWTMLPGGRFGGALVEFGGMTVPGGPSIDRAGSPTVSLDVPRIVFDLDGEPTDTTSFFPLTIVPIAAVESAVVGQVTVRAAALPDARPLQTSMGVDSVRLERPVAQSDDIGFLRIVRTSTAGDTVFDRRLSYRPRSVEAPYRDSVIAARLDGYRERSDDVAGLERALREMTRFAPYHPPVLQLAATDDGIIWLLRETGAGEGWRWALLDQDGTPLGEVLTPPGARPLGGSRGAVYMLERDDLSVPWLAKYRLVAATDSGGVRVSESGASAWGDFPGWEIGPRPVMEIGSPSGAGADALTRVADVLLLRDGRVVVSEALSRELRVFGPGGEHVVSMGGPGSGPGEFGFEPSLGSVGDSLMAWDVRQRRLSWFRADGLLIGTETVPAHVALPNTFVAGAWKVLADGSLVSVRSSGGRMLVNTVRRGDGWAMTEVVAVDYARTLLAAPDDPSRGPRLIMSSPFNRRPATAVAPERGEVFVADASSWEIRRYGVGGELGEVWRWPGTGRLPVTPSLIAEGRDSLGADVVYAFNLDLVHPVYDRLEHPDFAVRIGSLHYDPAGFLWAGHARPLSPNGTIDTFDILELGGRWLGTLVMPPDAGSVRAVAHGRVATVWNDGFGVPYLRVYSVLARE